MTTPRGCAATFGSMSPVVHATRADGIETITLDRAPVNALGPAGWSAIRDAIVFASDDVAVRVVVLSGGEGRFCAGADIRTLTEPTDEPALMLRVVGEAAEAIRSCRVPVIAAIDGAAHGGGLELALACDIRIASTRATFAASGVNMGLVASVYSLVHGIGANRARHMLLTGTTIDATTAERWGAVTQLDDDPYDAAISMARDLATKAPLALEATKAAVAASLRLDDADHTNLMTRHFTELAGSSDHQEAISAFLEKRPPLFTRR